LGFYTGFEFKGGLDTALNFNTHEVLELFLQTERKPSKVSKAAIVQFLDLGYNHAM